MAGWTFELIVSYPLCFAWVRPSFILSDSECDTLELFVLLNCSIVFTQKGKGDLEPSCLTVAEGLSVINSPFSKYSMQMPRSLYHDSCKVRVAISMSLSSHHCKIRLYTPWVGVDRIPELS